MGAPEITEEYQRKLQAYIAAIPALPGQINSGTPSLPNPTSATIAAQERAGGFTTDAAFNRYTGWTHPGLLKKWLKDRTTTCNEFCRTCSYAMGLPEDKIVGRFDIADVLARTGLGHCWVPVDSGATPAYGDIFRLLGSGEDQNKVRRNHMGVFLNLDGGKMHSVDSGQGGPSTGHDVIRYVVRDWKPPSLRGWVSIKALLNAGQPVHHWLGGWWDVTDNLGSTWYYHFGANGRVSATTSKPISPNVAPPNLPYAAVGTYGFKGMFRVIVTWNDADGDETIDLHPEPKKRKYEFFGKAADNTKFTGKRIMRPNQDE